MSLISSISPPTSPTLNRVKRDREEDSLDNSVKLARFGEKISPTLSESSNILETKNISLVTERDIDKRVESVVDPVLPDQKMKSITITIVSSKDDPSSYPINLENLCHHSALFGAIIAPSTTETELKLLLSQIDGAFNDGQGHSLETIEKVFQFFSTGEASYLEDESADAMNLLCAYLSLGVYFQSTSLQKNAQECITVDVSQLDAEQLHVIAQVAKNSHAHLLANQVLDECIAYFMNACINSEGAITAIFEYQTPESEFDVRRFVRCKEIIRDIGYMKKDFTFDLSDHYFQSFLKSTYPGLLSYCPSLEILKIKNFEADESKEVVHDFNQLFLKILPDLKQLKELDIIVFAPGERSTLQTYITLINQRETPLDKLSIQMYAYEVSSNKYEEMLRTLESIDEKKVKLLDIIFEPGYCQLKNLPFLQSRKLKLKFICSYEDMKDEDERQLVLSNLEDANRFSGLEKLTLIHAGEEINNAAKQFKYKVLLIK